MGFSRQEYWSGLPFPSPGHLPNPGTEHGSPALRASLVAQRLECLPPMQETRVQPLGWEDALEKEMVTHSNILAWRIPRTEKLMSFLGSPVVKIHPPMQETQEMQV